MLEYMEYEGRVLNKTVYVGNGVIMVIFCVFVFVMFVREVTMGASSSSANNQAPEEITHLYMPRNKDDPTMWDEKIPADFAPYMSQEIYT